MGALHEGHADLLDAARSRADVLVASIFVNPLQFGPDEDFGRYPRDLDADLAVCAAHAVDVVFVPSVEQMYPSGAPLVTVDPGPLGEILEGAVRPGHFKGVLTVVAKLFNLTQPDVAVFGEKDYQQLVLVQRLVTDLSLGIDVDGVATRREPDGLALSSRNRFLDARQRRRAARLSAALRHGTEAGPAGRDAVLGAASGVLDAVPGLTLDYLSLRTPDLTGEATSGPARLLAAARVGSTRLIDNLPVQLP
jgi:pantoate--beta-alanine ligase